MQRLTFAHSSGCRRRAPLLPTRQRLTRSTAASSRLEQDAQHAAQRLGRAPQQLVADGEGAEVFRAHRQLAQAADRDVSVPVTATGVRSRMRRFAVVRHHLHPVVVGGDHALRCRPAARPSSA